MVLGVTIPGGNIPTTMGWNCCPATKVHPAWSQRKLPAAWPPAPNLAPGRSGGAHWVILGPWLVATVLPFWGVEMRADIGRFGYHVGERMISWVGLMFFVFNVCCSISEQPRIACLTSIDHFGSLLVGVQIRNVQT